MDAKRRAPATLEDISRKLDSLLRLAGGLAEEVMVLHDRIEPFEGEVRRTLDIRTTRKAGPVTLDTLAGLVRGCDDVLGGISMDTRAIRSKLDMITGDAVSVQDMKPYVKQHPRRPR